MDIMPTIANQYIEVTRSHNDSARGALRANKLLLLSTYPHLHYKDGVLYYNNGKRVVRDGDVYKIRQRGKVLHKSTEYIDRLVNSSEGARSGSVGLKDSIKDLEEILAIVNTAIKEKGYFTTIDLQCLGGERKATRWLERMKRSGKVKTIGTYKNKNNRDIQKRILV